MGHVQHRKQIRHFHEPGHLHELTFSCVHRRPLLTTDARMRMLARCLDQATSREHFQLVAFVFMPEHVHLLVNPRGATPNISRFLARIKQPFSKWIRGTLESGSDDDLQNLPVTERQGRKSIRFWQAGPGFDRNIYSREAIEASIHYIHENPVRRNLVLQAVDWQWSSARYYLLEPPCQQFAALPHVDGIPEGALD
ncbi:transposase [Maioricimonas sp. JC845]|uniref:REP-associated tyrosine transposase n=1 Tax=Maioricimonas sp. JC845 TaxID=3232138 RepID=UPI00345816DC